MKSEVLEKLDIPAELKRYFLMTLGLELNLLSNEGKVPAKLEPLFQDIYKRIAAKESAESVKGALERLLSKPEV